MKYLLVDDMTRYLKSNIRALLKAGHVVEIAEDIGEGWTAIMKEAEAGAPFDLVLLDLALDQRVREFDKEHDEMIDLLTAMGYGDLPRSGQSLGIRLWRQRGELRQRYCYVTNHTQIWLGNIDKKDPEFGGGNANDHLSLVLDKSDIWSENVQDLLRRAYDVWGEEGWI